MPLVSIVPAILSRISVLMLWHHLDSFWPYYGLVVAAFVPWLSVINPLVTLVFVERYRNHLAGLFGRIRKIARVGPAGDQQQQQLPMTTMANTSKAPTMNRAMLVQNQVP